MSKIFAKLLLAGLGGASGLLHPLTEAHFTGGRATFTVCASDDGTFPALLDGRGSPSGSAASSSLSVRVNGRRSHLPVDRGGHALPLRRGLNTVAYSHMGLAGAAGGGLTVRGAVPCDTQPALTTLEAEDAVCTGTLLGPTYTGHTATVHLATEASGRRACQLSTFAEYVEFTAPVGYSALAIRFSIPDAPTGGGLSSQIRVAVMGGKDLDVPEHQILQNISSDHSWVYGTLPCKPPNYCNDPKDGLPSHFYDEVRMDLSNKGTAVQQPGTRIRLAMPLQPQLIPAPLLNCTAVPFEERHDCGFSGVTPAQCEAKGCCWDPHPAPNPDHHPYCFHKPAPPAPPAPFTLTFTLTIDLIDLYTVPAPYEPVAGAVSVIDHGADPSGARDSKAAFQSALAAAGRTVEAAVWVPVGDYLLLGHVIMVRSPIISTVLQLFCG